jgi:predicted RecB family endonuclease
MSSVKRDKFFKSKFEGVNPIRDLMNSDTFFEIEENLVQLNAAFKVHPDLEVLSVDDMFATLEEFVGHDIKSLKTLSVFKHTEIESFVTVKKDISSICSNIVC